MFTGPQVAEAVPMSLPTDITPAPGGAAAPPAPPSPARHGWSAGSIAAAVSGGVIGLAGLALALAGAVLALAFAFARDDDGYFNTDREALRTTTPALTAQDIRIEDVDVDGTSLADELVGRVRVQAESASDKPVFVGIARERDLDAYLGGVARDRVEDFGGWPGDTNADLTRQPGTSRVDPPADQDIWVSSSAGRGERTAGFDLREGDWAIAVMNADGSPGVSADVRGGAEAPAVLWIGVGLLAVGLVGFAGGLALTAAGIRRGERS
jgi:hypothetical protein